MQKKLSLNQNAFGIYILLVGGNVPMLSVERKKVSHFFFFFFFLVSFFSHPSQLDFVYDAFPHYSTLHNYHQLQNGFKLSMEHLVVKNFMSADTETLPNKYLADSYFQV